MNPQSPRLARFLLETKADPGRALQALKADLKTTGGPLVEPIEGGPDVAVSFVWLGDERPVSLRGAPLFGDHTAMSRPMERLADTGVWALTARVAPEIVVTYQFLIDDPFSAAAGADLTEQLRLFALAGERSFADPFNPRRMFPQSALLAGEASPAIDRWESLFALGGEAEEQLFAAGADASPHLETHSFTLPGLGERGLSVWRPPGAGGQDGGLPIVLLLDGEAWVKVADMPLGLARLVQDGRMRPALVAFLDNLEGPAGIGARMRDLACDLDFTAALADHVVPFLRQTYRASSRPEDTIIGGSSLGGLAAAYAAFERPDVFGAVLACSGTFVWGQQQTPGGWGKDAEPEWLTRRYAAAPLRPVRFWISGGQLETGITPLASGVDARAANRHLRDVLTAKGNAVTYGEIGGGHDFANFRRSAARGLQTLLPPAGGE